MTTDTKIHEPITLVVGAEFCIEGQCDHMPTVRAAVAEYGPVVGMAATAKALRDSGWDRDDLVLLLAVALVRSVGEGADQ